MHWINGTTAEGRTVLIEREPYVNRGEAISRREIADVYNVPIWMVDLERRVPPRGLRWTWRVGRWWRRPKDWIACMRSGGYR